VGPRFTRSKHEDKVHWMTLLGGYCLSLHRVPMYSRGEEGKGATLACRVALDASNEVRMKRQTTWRVAWGLRS